MNLPLDLTAFCNNVGVTSDSSRSRGDFDGWGRSFPREELAASAPHALVRGPLSDGEADLVADNVACEGQLLPFPRALEVTSFRFVGAAEGGSFLEPVLFESHGSSTPVGRMLGLTDWLAPVARYNEALDFRGTHVHERDRDLAGPRPSLWSATMMVPGGRHYSALRLPENPSLHIFAVRLQFAPP